MINRCLFLLVGLHAVVVYTTPPIGARTTGICPFVDRNTVGACITECGNDEDCPESMKCCRNGCGQTCVKPLDCVDVDGCSGKPAGNYRYCNSCQKYVTCVFNNGYLRNCPSGTAFDGTCVGSSAECGEVAASTTTTPQTTGSPPYEEIQWCYSDTERRETECRYDIGENVVVTVQTDLGESTSPYIACTKNVNWYTPYQPGSKRQRLVVRGGCCAIFKIQKTE